MSASKKVARNNDVAWRMIEGEILAVDPKTSFVYVFNGVGSRVWELADGGRTIAEIARMIDAEFEGEKTALAEDIDDFVRELSRQELISIG